MTSRRGTTLVVEDVARLAPGESTPDDSGERWRAPAWSARPQAEETAAEVLLDQPLALADLIAAVEQLSLLPVPPPAALVPIPITEATLVARAVRGDQDAFIGLYDQYVAAVHRYVYSRVNHYEDTEDLTQQVFLQAWAALGRFEQRERPFGAWLFTIAHHVVVNHYRTISRTRHRDQRAFEQQRRLADGTADGHPDLIAEERWEQERVGRAIRTLRPLHQQVIILRFLRGMKQQAIAGIVGKSYASVRVIQHRALRQLRSVLERQEV